MKLFVSYTYRAPNDRVCFGSVDIDSKIPKSSDDVQKLFVMIKQFCHPMVLTDLRILAWSVYDW